MTDPRPVARLAGGALAAVALGADSLGLGVRGSGVGLVQAGAAFLGLATAAAGLAGPAAARAALRALLALGGLYAALVLCDLAPFPPPPPNVRARGPSLLPIFEVDADLGYRLRAGAEARFDDGLARGLVRTNSFGRRDAEPTGRETVLVVGNSFAFGALLDQDETLDAALERLSGGRLAVSNAGVPGYGPAQALGTLRRCGEFVGRRVVYLFYENDLRPSDQDSAAWPTVHRGRLVPRRDADGRPYDAAEFDRMVDEIERPPARPLTAKRLRAALQLRRLRARLPAWRTLAARAAVAAAEAEAGPAEVRRAVEATRAMAEEAAARGASFLVVAAPSRSSVRLGRHPAPVEAYLAEVRAAGIAVLPLLGRLDEADYWPHDPHWNARGASKAAAAILETLEAGGG